MDNTNNTKSTAIIATNAAGSHFFILIKPLQSIIIKIALAKAIKESKKIPIFQLNNHINHLTNAMIAKIV